MMLRIRQARGIDAAGVLGLRRAAILAHCPTHYPMPLLQRWVEGGVTPAFEAFVAEKVYLGERDGALLACGALDSDSGQIDAVFVDPTANGHGYARAMMAFLEERARTLGLETLRLDATLNAAPFYRRLGFIGDSQGRYDSPRGFSLPCIPMSKTLLPGG
ncbi:MAG: GNAT family N-acetyltransferase [Paludibacterium sp.]|uniref:GNAT family N-acetyltransferase n=1 Tax=Paludibacterium sp. TaxID=1917523 RepID=UPI0025CED83C|nr:GNAT family N-acetyltransferase [Paludibacterium sp.]MBV8047127.1 GNAT family N-acetyltransferase [Paludibacterium sp.]MBV8648742.1 GNAT family N-acetyltransferase [Paludibacterium sp.]